MSVDVQPPRREVALGNYSNEVKRFGTPATATPLGGALDEQAMAAVIDRSLYRAMLEDL